MNSKKKMTACLLIHGFAGDSSEIEPLACQIEAMGIDCKRTTLKGHGLDGIKLDMKGIGYVDWIESARQDFIELKQEYEKVIVIGFSMGGLIGINLCSQEDNHAEALILVNTPYYFWDFKVIYNNIVEDMKHQKTDALKHYLQTCIDKPLFSYFEFNALLNKAKGKIKDISCDLYIFQSIDDDTTHFKSALRIYKLKDSNNHVQYFNSGGHHVLQKNSDAVKRIAHTVAKICQSYSIDERGGNLQYG